MECGDVHEDASGVVQVWPTGYKVVARRPVVAHHATSINHMANYDANYSPSADPAAPITGEENADDHAADIATETTAQEDHDAA